MTEKFFEFIFWRAKKFFEVEILNELIKNFLEREFAEIEKNKFRIAGIIFLVAFGIVFIAKDYFGNEEENISTETARIEDKNISAEKIPDQKNNEVQKVSDQNITKIIGANADLIYLNNPFKMPEVADIEEVEEEKISETEEKTAPVVIVQKPEPKKNSSPPTDEEKFILAGTAISENKKTALFEHYSGKKFEGTLFLKVGDNLNGKFITEIGEDIVILSNGEKLYAD